MLWIPRLARTAALACLGFTGTKGRAEGLRCALSSSDRLASRSPWADGDEIDVDANEGGNRDRRSGSVDQPTFRPAHRWSEPAKTRRPTINRWQIRDMNSPVIGPNAPAARTPTIVSIHR